MRLAVDGLAQERCVVISLPLGSRAKAWSGGNACLHPLNLDQFTRRMRSLPVHVASNVA